MTRMSPTLSGAQLRGLCLQWIRGLLVGPLAVRHDDRVLRLAEACLEAEAERGVRDI